MKKAKIAFGILLFFLSVFCTNFSCVNKAYAKQKDNIQLSNYVFECGYKNQTFTFFTNQFLKEIRLSKYQTETLSKNQNRLRLAHQLKAMGFSKKESLDYAFPELKHIVLKLSQKLNIDTVQDSVFVVKNKCKLSFKDGSSGSFFNVEDFYNQVFRKKDTRIIKTNVLVSKTKYNKTLKNEFVERGCFSTSFKTSAETRKNNIRTALSIFDGLILDIGEILSFNQITGSRTKENGYSSAKIISGGVFTSGFGGGVCQVSTTLYNACLLSGLEIKEVHNHSLPVGYVEPSFDAMVNIGSSDLVIKNNTDGKIIITTSFEDDICKVKIFGKPNRFKIKRVSEKTENITAPPDVIETDISKHPDHVLEVGEEKRISYAKDGYKSKGSLEYFDQAGNFVKRVVIRKDSYAPVKGIILKREK